jgi:hypothetical protein
VKGYSTRNFAVADHQPSAGTVRGGPWNQWMPFLAAFCSRLSRLKQRCTESPLPFLENEPASSMMQHAEPAGQPLRKRKILRPVKQALVSRRHIHPMAPDVTCRFSMVHKDDEAPEHSSLALEITICAGRLRLCSSGLQSIRIFRTVSLYAPRRQGSLRPSPN